MAHVVISSAQNFDEEVLKSDIPIFVDFWAEWCGPCKMVAPIFEELSESYAGRIKFAKVDTDALPDLAARYGVQSIPTMIAFKGGAEASRTIGAHPKQDYVAIIDGLL